MAKIVAFSVPSIADGQTALDTLDDLEDVKDVALVYRTDKGKVKIRQTSDVTAGKGMARGAMLGAVVGLFAGPVVGAAAVAGVGGGALGALGDRGVDNKLMKLAGEQLENGQAAVFVLAEDGTADAIAGKIRSLSNLAQFAGQLEVGEFSDDAQKLVKEHLKLDAAA